MIRTHGASNICPLLAGMNKLVVTHLNKIILTSDGATIVRELEVLHPAAKMIVMASQMQEKEFGDGTSLVVSIAGEMLNLAADLLRSGLHAAEILEGYKRGYAKALELLPTLVCHTLPGECLRQYGCESVS